MSIKMSKQCPGHLKNIFWTLFVIENGAGGSSGCRRFGRDPIFDPKNVQKMCLKCFSFSGTFFLFLLTFFLGRRTFFWHFSDGIGNTGNDIFYTFFFWIFELIQPNSLGQPNHCFLSLVGDCFIVLLASSS